MNGNGNGIWRSAALTLAGAVIGLLGGRVGTSPESDYARDAATIKQHFEYADRTLQQQSTDLRDLLGQLADARAQLKVMNAQVEAMTTVVKAHGR